MNFLQGINKAYKIKYKKTASQRQSEFSQSTNGLFILCTQSVTHFFPQHQQTWNRDQAKMMNAFRIVSAAAFKRKMITSEEYTKYYISGTVSSSWSPCQKLLYVTKKSPSVGDLLIRRWVEYCSWSLRQKLP